jgi:hypothetical protein
MELIHKWVEQIEEIIRKSPFDKKRS